MTTFSSVALARVHRRAGVYIFGDGGGGVDGEVFAEQVGQFWKLSFKFGGAY